KAPPSSSAPTRSRTPADAPGKGTKAPEDPARGPSARSEREKTPTHPAAGPADKVWDDYFRTHRPDPVAVSDVALRLHKEGRPEELIDCLEAALKQGHSQPWMYTVLALAMDKAHRPKSEIERVLLSGIDYSAVNV